MPDLFIQPPCQEVQEFDKEGKCVEGTGQDVIEVKVEVQFAIHKFPCIVCKKKFNNKAEMKHHVRAIHFAPVFICEECGARVHKKKQEKHQSEHQGPVWAMSRRKRG